MCSGSDGRPVLTESEECWLTVEMKEKCWRKSQRVTKNTFSKVALPLSEPGFRTSRMSLWPACFYISDHSVAAKSGGCFPGEALVTLESGGTKSIRDLRPGERVLALAVSGSPAGLVYSEVLAFLDREPGTRKLFYMLHTKAGPRLSLTAAHLLFVSEGNCSEGAEPSQSTLKTVYASHARPGQCVLVSQGHSEVYLSQITQVTVREGKGAFAPLTQLGTLVVDNVAASCYAVINQHSLAHWAFWPLRLLHRWTGAAVGHGDGMHWYSRLLHWLGRALLDSGQFHPLGVAQGARWGTWTFAFTRDVTKYELFWAAQELRHHGSFLGCAKRGEAVNGHRLILHGNSWKSANISDFILKMLKW